MLPSSQLRCLYESDVLYKNKTEDTFQNNTAEQINCNVNGKLKMFISYTFVLSVNLLGQQGLAKILFELSWYNFQFIGAEAKGKHYGNWKFPVYFLSENLFSCQFEMKHKYCLNTRIN